MRYSLRSLTILMAVMPPALGLTVPPIVRLAWYVGHDLRAQIIVLLVGLLALPVAFAILNDIWRHVRHGRRPNS